MRVDRVDWAHPSRYGREVADWHCAVPVVIDAPAMGAGACGADGGALVVGALLHEGQVVQLHLRDAETSAADLERLLARDCRANALV